MVLLKTVYFANQGAWPKMVKPKLHKAVENGPSKMKAIENATKKLERRAARRSKRAKVVGVIAVRVHIRIRGKKAEEMWKATVMAHFVGKK
jgi:sarcosine oxidase gamma subunit